MSEFQKQLALLILDKGLLALLLGAFAFAAKRYLDRVNAQRTYTQTLAQERIRAYKEISRIVSEQVLAMARIPKILERVAEMPAAKEKMAADFADCYVRLGEDYRTEMPKLQAELIFVSARVADILIAYIDAFGGFMQVPHDLNDGVTSRPPDKGIMVLSAELLNALSDELEQFRVDLTP